MNCFPAGGYVLLAMTLALPVAAVETARELRAANYLAANCTNCHRTTGAESGGIPSLRGHSRAELARMLREFRDGVRAATVMHQLAEGYSDAQIDQLALFFARHPLAIPRDVAQ